MPKINGKIYYNNVTGNVLLVVNQNEGVWLRETTFAEDVATYPQLKEVASNVISVIRLAWDQYKADFAVSRPVKVVDGKLTWVPLDVPETPAEDKPFSERVAELEAENKLLKLQSEAHATNYQFLEDVVTELIITTMP
ncbi:hypothetical protein [Exiguobacterium sp. S3]|uniref:hypothetical protein n=1 Tax=Exiguobacterium sp. S3 TaxID=483245 RepID=UPI001BE5181D|nr:hypothetical protein [Exiguobacterium sp. S3]